MEKVDKFDMKEVIQPPEEMVKKAVKLEEWLADNTSGPKEGTCVLAMVMARMRDVYGMNAEAHMMDVKKDQFVQTKGEA